MSELQLPKNCVQLIQIGKSNNSHIYKGVDKSGKPLDFALKLIVHSQKGVHQKECLHLKNEACILSQLRQENIIRQCQGEFQEFVCLKGAEFCALFLELGESDLFDEMSRIYPKVLTPDQIRHYFRQINASVTHMHEQGFSHNDIKLENVFLFESKKKAKLADFGFSDQVSNQIPEQQKQKWINRCKTMLAPEILSIVKTNLPQTQVFDETKSDIFALGITLFQSLFLRTPFANEHASISDPLFKHFYSGQTDKFWKSDEIQSILTFINKQSNFRQEQFIDLINNMLQVNPKTRFTIHQVIQHPWFN